MKLLRTAMIVHVTGAVAARSGGAHDAPCATNPGDVMTGRAHLTGGRRALARLGQLLVAYLVAGAVETIVFSELRGGGHADAPLSTFPEYLLLAPAMPVAVVIHFLQSHAVLAVVSTAVFVVCFIASWVAYRRWLPWDLSRRSQTLDS